MKVGMAVSILGLALLGGARVDAGWFGGGNKLPQAIDSPIVRPHLKDPRKAYNLKIRLKQDAQPGWGAQRKQLFFLPYTPPTGHYNR
jgi:hypothetical protein